MRKTRTSEQQESALQFLRSEEFEEIISKAVKKETKILHEKIQKLGEEIIILRESNIELVHLLTTLPKYEKKVPKITKYEDVTYITKKKDKLKSNNEETPENMKEKTSAESQIIISEDPQIIMETNSDYSSIIKRQRKTNSSGITGKGSTNINNLKAAEKKIEMYITRLHKDTTVNDITEFLKKKFPEVRCEQGQSKFPECYSSFKITINENNYNSFMNPDLWPSGIYINKFFRKRNTTSHSN